LSAALRWVHAQALQQRTKELNIKKAIRRLSEISTLSNEQKARLLYYLCYHPVAAAAVPDKIPLCEIFFQDLLKQLDTEQVLVG